MLRFLILSRAKTAVLVLVLGYMFILSPPQVAAQGIDVDPLSWDFGDVEIGTLETKTFTISPTELLPLTVESISFTAGSSSAFSFEEFLLSGTDPITGVSWTNPIASVPPSYTLFMTSTSPHDYLLEVIVGFSPDSLGLHTASIRIDSDAASPDDQLYVPLSGTCVPVPSSMLLACIGLAAGLAGLKRRFRGQ